jgi:hypothetical protein
MRALRAPIHIRGYARREPRRSSHCSKTPSLIVFSQWLRRPGTGTTATTVRLLKPHVTAAGWPFILFTAYLQL